MLRLMRRLLCGQTTVRPVAQASSAVRVTYMSIPLMLGWCDCRYVDYEFGDEEIVIAEAMVWRVVLRRY
jgi:hypothetical protein